MTRARFAVALLVGAASLGCATEARADDEPPRPAEVWLGIGYGSAVCDDKKPTSDCPVDGGTAFHLGGAWRFHRSFAAGLELAGWSFKVREAWRGKLASDATDVTFGSSYLALLGRWYFLSSGSPDAYLQAGFGGGSVKGHAENAGNRYDVTVSGVVVPVGIGAGWRIGSHVRLGPEALAYLQKSSRVCETTNGSETCKASNSDQNALPWRVGLVVTGLFGAPLGHPLDRSGLHFVLHVSVRHGRSFCTFGALLPASGSQADTEQARSRHSMVSEQALSSRHSL